MDTSLHDEPLIRASGLAMRYGSKLALDDVSFSIPKESWCA
jgi:ABC-type branched-subunit amino acid transport system ATPase component